MQPNTKLNVKITLKHFYENITGSTYYCIMIINKQLHTNSGNYNINLSTWKQL